MLLLAVILAGALVAWFLYEKARRRSHPVKGGLQADVTLPYEAEFELYSNSFSHCSRKTRIVMAELGIPYVHKPIDLIETGSYETISPAYLAINPSGLVPTLVHNGHPVYESDDILSYAAEHAPPGGEPLVPSDPAKKTEMDRWIEFASISSDDPMGGMERSAGSCIPPLTMPLFITAIRYIPLHRIAVGLLFHYDKVRPIFFTAGKLLGLRRLLGQKPLRQMVHRGRDQMRRHLLELERQLEKSGGPWLLSGQYTLADVSLTCMLLRLDETGWLDQYFSKDGLAKVGDYYAALRARPSWKQSITDKAHPIIEQASGDLRRAIETDPGVRAALYG